MENEETNVGAWFNKDNWRDMRLIFDSNEQPPEGYIRARPLYGVVYQFYDEESGEWIADPNSEVMEKVDACKAELGAVDREAGAGRAVRGLALTVAEQAGIESEDFDKLKEFEDQAESLREEIKQLEQSIAGV
jgi:hypothetical protein